MAAERVKRARAAGVRFGFLGADGLYGHATWLLFEWDDAGELFATEVHSDQQFYFADPGKAWVLAWEAREWAARLMCIPRKLDTHSTPNWTLIPRQTGQSERSDAG